MTDLQATFLDAMTRVFSGERYRKYGELTLSNKQCANYMRDDNYRGPPKSEIKTPIEGTVLRFIEYKGRPCVVLKIDWQRDAVWERIVDFEEFKSYVPANTPVTGEELSYSMVVLRGAPKEYYSVTPVPEIPQEIVCAPIRGGPQYGRDKKRLINLRP